MTHQAAEERPLRLRPGNRSTGQFRFDHVADAKPHRLFVWRRFVLASLSAAKANNRRQILAHAVTIQTLFQVRIESELIPLRNRSVNQIVDELLTYLAVHCLPPSSCLKNAHKSN
jgi:hypothetical protein